MKRTVKRGAYPVQYVANSHRQLAFHPSRSDDPELYDPEMVLLTHSSTSSDTTYVRGSSWLASKHFFTSDNDVVGLEISLPTGGLQVGEGTDIGAYRMRLKTRPAADVTIRALNTDGQLSVEMRDAAYLTFTREDWNAFKTVNVIGVPEGTKEEEFHEGKILHSSTSTDAHYNTLTFDTVSALITDKESIKDKTPAPILVQAALSDLSLSFTIEVDRDVDVAGLNIRLGINQLCTQYDYFVEATTNLIGAGSLCAWTDAKNLLITYTNAALRGGDVITLKELANIRAKFDSVFRTTGSLTLKGRTPQPHISEARFGLSGASLEVTFSRPTSALINDELTSAPCEQVFQEAASTFGLNSVCTFSTATTIVAELGIGATVLPDSGVFNSTSQPCEANSMSSMTLLAGAVKAVRYSFAFAEGCATILPPRVAPQPKATVLGRWVQSRAMREGDDDAENSCDLFLSFLFSSFSFSCSCS